MPVAFDPPYVTVFCGSRLGGRPEYATAAEDLGRTLVKNGLGLVYGGGSVGLMGKIADSVLEAGGEVIGVIPEVLSRPEIAHPNLTKLHVVDSMHTRKMMMNDLCGAFIAMPGGIGTFEELFEVLSWAQLRIHAKPIGLLDVAGFWTSLRGLVDGSTAEGFINPIHRELLIRAVGSQELLDLMGDAAVAEADPDAVNP
jgi:uncharacterized protein (TIGR00730 family)